MGFSETTPDEVRGNIRVEGDTLTSCVNGKTFTCGRLEIPTLAELRDQVRASAYQTGSIVLREVVANVQDLHAEPSNAGSLFQVASGFNLLEMASPSATPEHGVGIYENDRTQGPACAVAAGAGTIYRNYFVEVNGQRGQSATNQIDCLRELGKVLGNSGNRLWKMKNGYALATRSGLLEITSLLRDSDEGVRDQLRRQVRIGVHWNTQVTTKDSGHLVTQAYCSALPVGYSPHPFELWEDFARLILEASYEATICAGMLNSLHTGNNSVFLTLIGGGVFENKTCWILDAIMRALNLYQDRSLEVSIVSYGASNASVSQFVEQFQG
jgi:hypothetical protein